MAPWAVSPTICRRWTRAPAVDQNAEIELAFWRSLEQSSDPAEYQEYLRRFPDGTFALLARNRLRDLQGPASQAPTATDKTVEAPSPPAASARPATAPPPETARVEDVPSVGSTNSTESRRCANILARSQLGEPLSAANLALLRECGS